MSNKQPKRRPTDIKVKGGVLRPVGNNIYSAIGRSHAENGMWIPKSPYSNIEFEGGETIAEQPDSIIIGSKEKLINEHSDGSLTPAIKPFGGNISPAKAMKKGYNPEYINDVQQAYKDRFNLNDDGTKRSGGKNKAALGLKDIAKKIYKGVNPIGYFSNKYILPHVMNEVLQRSAGIGDISAIFPIMFSAIDKNRYDGKLHMDNYTEKLDFTNTVKDNNRNLVRLYTLQDSTGFKPSTIGVGKYENTKFGNLKTYAGKFYGDTTYLPIEYYDKIKNIDDSVVYLNKDNVHDYPNQYYLEDTDDVAHHTTTLKRNGKKYIARHEDVFDTNSILDYVNHPFIINQDTPIYFTRNKEKLARYPYLTKSLSEFIDNHQKDNKKAMGGKLTIVPFTGKLANARPTVARMGTKKALIGTKQNLTADNIMRGNDGTIYYRDERGFVHPVSDTDFVDGKLSRIDNKKVIKDNTPVNLNYDNIFSNIEFPVADLTKDGDVTWLNRRPGYSYTRTSRDMSPIDKANIAVATDDSPITFTPKQTKDRAKRTKAEVASRNRARRGPSIDEMISLGNTVTSGLLNNKPNDIYEYYTTDELPEVVVSAQANKNNIKTSTNNTSSPTSVPPAANNTSSPTSTVTSVPTKPTESTESTSNNPNIIVTDDGQEVIVKQNVKPSKPRLTRTRVSAEDEPIVSNDNNPPKRNILKDSWNYVKNNAEDIIPTGINILGSVGSWLTNNIAINRMREPSAPVPKLATKLKTRININPQLDKMRETAAAYARNVRQNTASSAVALNRLNRVNFANTQQVNQLYGQKENMETELINKDKLNQQSVANSNVDSYNQYLDKVTEFNNRKQELKSENATALFQGINNAIQSGLTRRDKRRQYELTKAYLDKVYPVAARYMNS